VITIIAVLRSLSSPTNCHEEAVTTSDLADVSMQSGLMGAPRLAEWMKQHPAERLVAWRCQIGELDGKARRSFFIDARRASGRTSRYPRRQLSSAENILALN
jgi:hypothetical protein